MHSRHTTTIYSRTDVGRPSILHCEKLESRQMLSGTWTTVTAAFPPGGAQSGVVLTDGSIMVHAGGGNQSKVWYKLTPSASGSYVAGTWSALASSNVGRLYTATDMLTSGKVLTVGGEYSSGSSDTNTGEIYDPVANTWSNITNFPNANFGDDPSALLPNGQILAGYISGAATYIYNPAANTWTATGSKLRNDRSDEESWVTLPDHSVLSYDVFSSTSTTPHAQRYVPASGTWVDAGTPPAILSTSNVGYELGPGLLLPDGRALFTGGNNNTAYYSESTNSWTAGPAMPNGYVMADAPGAILPNGNVLLAMSPLGTLSSGTYTFPSPTKIYELNTTTNVYTDVTPSVSGVNMNQPSFVYTLLVLPTGQIALFEDNGTVAVYTESGSPLTAATPVINGITYAGTTGVYTLSGTNLNGINDGAAYGDDNEMASNYPLVRLTDASGNVTYARTSNWSNTGVFQGVETVTFTLPAADTTGAYLVQSVANGVPSATALAVLINANTTQNVVLAAGSGTFTVSSGGVGGSVVASFPVTSFSSIYIVGDNSGDLISVNFGNTLSNVVTTIEAGTGTDTINVNSDNLSSDVVIAPSAGNDAVNVGISGISTAFVEFQVSQQIGVLTVNSGSLTFIDSTTKQLLQTTGLVFNGGSLNLNNSDMIVHGGNLGGITAALATGYASGNWNGTGINSSAANADTRHLTALGVIQNSFADSPVYGSFDGQTVSVTDVLVKYTYYGDANLNGKVDGSDYSLIDNGYLTHATGWVNGDFDFSGGVNGSDYTLIDNAFNTQGTTIAAQIASPKPLIAAGKVATAAKKTAALKPAVIKKSAVALKPIKHA